MLVAGLRVESAGFQRHHQGESGRITEQLGIVQQDARMWRTILPAADAHRSHPRGRSSGQVQAAYPQLPPGLPQMVMGEC